MSAFLNFLKYNAFTSSIARQYYQIRCQSLQNIIFVATTGRSGTKTLVDIFNHIPGCAAEHEPYPAMFDEVLKNKSKGDEKFVKKIYWRIKSINLLRAAAGYSHYFESNHMFIKTYIEYAVEDFADKLIVIHLVRDPVKVANSIFSLQDYPGTEEGNKWWLNYSSSNNLISISDYLDKDAEFKHPFYRGLWYWYEVEARIKDWKTRLPNVRFIDFQTEDFNSSDKTFQLLRDLNIQFDQDALEKKIRTKSNTRLHQKNAKPLPLEEAQNKHMAFKKLLKDLGHINS